MKKINMGKWYLVSGIVLFLTISSVSHHTAFSGVGDPIILPEHLPKIKNESEKINRKEKKDERPVAFTNALEKQLWRTADI